jgi:hypothetical protein
MATCISKDMLETSMCIGSVGFDGGEIFAEFVIRLENNMPVCFCFIFLSIGMGYMSLT